MFNYDSMTKFIEQPYLASKFKFLEDLLVKEQHHLLEGLYVFIYGLKQIKVL